MRAFSLVITLHRRGLFDWNEFQSRLIEQVQAGAFEEEEGDSEAVYYRQWLAAFEPENVATAAVARTRIRLHHDHLPKLAEANLLEFDSMCISGTGLSDLCRNSSSGLASRSYFVLGVVV